MFLLLLGLAACRTARSSSYRRSHRHSRGRSHHRRSDKNFLGALAAVTGPVLGGMSSSSGSRATAQAQADQQRAQALSQQGTLAAQAMTQSKQQMDQMFATLDQRTALKAPKRPGIEELPKEIAPVTLEKVEIDRNEVLRLLERIV